jgi:hypothetical protein
VEKKVGEGHVPGIKKLPSRLEPPTSASPPRQVRHLNKEYPDRHRPWWLLSLHQHHVFEYCIGAFPLDLSNIQHAPIERLAWEHILLVFVNMKLRPSTSRSLQQQLQNPSRYRNVRPRVCLQCREQLHGHDKGMGNWGMAVRSIATEATPRSKGRQIRLVFPAPIIAGQRRTLATVQNGM